MNGWWAAKLALRERFGIALTPPRASPAGPFETARGLERASRYSTATRA